MMPGEIPGCSRLRVLLRVLKQPASPSGPSGDTGFIRRESHPFNPPLHRAGLPLIVSPRALHPLLEGPHPMTRGGGFFPRLLPRIFVKVSPPRSPGGRP